MPQIGDVYRVIVKGKLLGVVETRGMHTYVLTSANASEGEVALGLEGQMTTLYSYLHTNMVGSWMHWYEQETQKWHPRVLQEPGYWLGYDVTAMNLTGLVAGDMTAFQAAILVTLKTAVKRTLGRKFFPGLAESLTTDGSLTVNAVNMMANVVGFLLQSVTFGAGGVAEPCILDKHDVPHQFIGGVVGSIISTMRRRKPGYGI